MIEDHEIVHIDEIEMALEEEKQAQEDQTEMALDEEHQHFKDGVAESNTGDEEGEKLDRKTF